MFAKQAVPDALLRLSRAQASTFTRAQALDAGLSPSALHRLVRERGVTRVAPSVFTWGLALPSAESRLWTAHLSCGPDSALGGRAALRGEGTELPTHLVVWVPPEARRLGTPGVVVRRDGEERLTHRRGTLPRIRCEDALLDIGIEDGLEEFIAVTAEAIRRGDTTATSVRRVLGRRGRVPHRALLAATLDDLAGIESNLEFIYRRDVERAHDLPPGRRQVSISVRTRSDVWYEDFGVLVEIDGRLAHPVGRFRDLHRDNEHVLLGQSTLRYGGFDLRTEPCHIAWQVGRLLAARGWAGVPTPCRRCPPGMGAFHGA